MKKTGMFEDLDTFLTNLIIERAPAADRVSLRAWLQPEAKPRAPKARKRKTALAGMAIA